MPIGTTQVQASNLHMNWKNDLHNQALVKNTMNALNLQILQTFDEEYWIPLWHWTLGYANVTQFEMITYLKDTYGKIVKESSILIKIKIDERYNSTTTLND